MGNLQQGLKDKVTTVETEMPIIIRNSPPGYDWGWYSREEPRMHLQTVDDKDCNEYKLWLEKGGRRTCEAATKIPPKILKTIEAAIARKRLTVEDRWVRFAILKGWLQAQLAGTQAIVQVYPNTPNAFTRVIDLTLDLTPAEVQALRPEDITLSAEMASLQIWPSRPEDERQDIRLSREIWQD